MKKGLVSQETDQSFSITGRNPHEEPILATTLKPAPHERPSRQTLKFAPHEERPSTSLIILKPTWHSSLFLCIRNDRSEKRN